MTRPSTTTWRTVRPSAAQRRPLRPARRRLEPELASSRGPTDVDGAAVDRRAGAAPGERLETRRPPAARTPRSRAPATIARASGCSESASTPAARRRTLVFVVAGRCRDVGEHRLALGQRAGLVEDDDVELARPLERQPVLDEQAVARAERGARWR